MAVKQVSIGSIGPFLFDDTVHQAVETDGKMTVDKVDSQTGVEVAGVEVVKTQQPAIADPAALTSADLSLANLADPTYGGDFTEIQTEFNQLRVDLADVRAQLIDALAMLRTHGLIAT